MPAPTLLCLVFSNPAAYPPLEHAANILADRGWNVQVLGARGEGTETLRWPSHPNICVTCLNAIIPGLRRKLVYLRYCFKAVFMAARMRPTWVSVSDYWVALPALWITWCYGTKVLYHEHDAPGLPRGVLQRIGHWARRRLMKDCELVVIPSAGRAHALPALKQGAVPLVVNNCPSTLEIPASAVLQANSQLLRLYYHGTIVPARMPLTLVEAMARYPGQVELWVAGYETIGSPGYSERLLERARARSIESQIHLLGAIPTRQELFNRAGKCDVGVSLLCGTQDDFNHATMLGASNKPFDYLACGLALLVNDESDWRTMLVKPGYALCCDPNNAESIASAIGEFLRNPEQRRAMGRAGRQRVIDDWNYETQFKPVLDQMCAVE